MANDDPNASWTCEVVRVRNAVLPLEPGSTRLHHQRPPWQLHAHHTLLHFALCALRGPPSFDGGGAPAVPAVDAVACNAPKVGVVAAEAEGHRGAGQKRHDADGSGVELPVVPMHRQKVTLLPPVVVGVRLVGLEAAQSRGPWRTLLLEAFRERTEGTIGWELCLAERRVRRPRGPRLQGGHDSKLLGVVLGLHAGLLVPPRRSYGVQPIDQPGLLVLPHKVREELQTGHAAPITAMNRCLRSCTCTS
mmetsp:Transcript_66161/g.215236  ORF Transcript_66161/g.215236 Transcript_66161/m.215236 type:complete len:248 (-) Transcript_66161:92-835(-)